MATRSRRSAAAAATAAIASQSSLAPYASSPSKARDADSDAPPTSTRRSRGLSKKVSYLEIPVGADEESEEEDGAGDDQEEGEQDTDDAPDTSGPRSRLSLRSRSNQQTTRPIIKLRRSTNNSLATRLPSKFAEPDADGDDDGEDAAEDAVDAEAASDEATPDASPAPEPVLGRTGSFRGRGRGRGRGKGRGRWAQRREVERDLDDDEDKADGEDSEQVGTPAGDDAEGSGKAVKRQLVKGEYYDVVGDEIGMDDDEKGELKIDKDGNLQGGREFKMFTFTSKDRSSQTRRYALTIEVARACGVFDTATLIRRCPFLHRINLTTSEKEWISREHTVSNLLRFKSVTMIAVRNAFKYQGAKLIKDGRWVVDDYYEDQALEDCKTQGLQPYSLVGALEAPTRNVTRDGDLAPSALNFSNRAPFYPIGGPTTHWGHAGVDPWTDARLGNKRTRLEAMGVSGENWMWKMALEARERERELRREREGRMVAFTMDGEVSVYDTERLPDKSAESGEGGDSASREPSAHPNAEYPFPKMNTLPVSQAMTRVRSSTFGASGTSMDKPAGDVVMADAVAEISSRPSATGGPSIVVEDEAETRARKVARRRRAEVGVMKGLYEPHTHMPHVFQDLQPTRATYERVAPLPLVTASPSDPPFEYPDTGSGAFSTTLNSFKVGRGARGLASVEYVHDSPWDAWAQEVQTKEQMVREAEQWAASNPVV